MLLRLKSNKSTKVISGSITLNIPIKIGLVCLYTSLYKITTKRIVTNTYSCLFFGPKRGLRADLVVMVYLETDSPLIPPGDNHIARPDFPATIWHKSYKASEFQLWVKDGSIFPY